MSCKDMIMLRMQLKIRRKRRKSDFSRNHSLREEVFCLIKIMQWRRVTHFLGKTSFLLSTESECWKTKSTRGKWFCPARCLLKRFHDSQKFVGVRMTHQTRVSWGSILMQSHFQLLQKVLSWIRNERTKHLFNSLLFTWSYCTSRRFSLRYRNWYRCSFLQISCITV